MWMAIEKFHAEVTFPIGHAERIMRQALPDEGRSEGPVSFVLNRIQRDAKSSVYTTLLPITAGYAHWLGLLGAEVRRIKKPRTLEVPAVHDLAETPQAEE